MYQVSLSQMRTDLVEIEPAIRAINLTFLCNDNLGRHRKREASHREMHDKLEVRKVGSGDWVGDVRVCWERLLGSKRSRKRVSRQIFDGRTDWVENMGKCRSS